MPPQVSSIAGELASVMTTDSTSTNSTSSSGFLDALVSTATSLNVSVPANVSLDRLVVGKYKTSTTECMLRAAASLGFVCLLS